MANLKLAGRYAKSLIDLAIEKKQLEVVFADAQYFNAVATDLDFVVFMRSPIIATEKKISVFEAIFKNKVSDLTQSFFRLIIVKGRESFLNDIMGEVINQYNRLKGITAVKLTSAVSLDNSTIQQIKKNIEQTTSLKNIELTTAIKESLIGGFVLEYEDKLFDSSIAHDLKEIKKQFLNNEYVKKY